MTDSQTIPDDILRAAWDAAGHIYSPDDSPGSHSYVRDIIAKAIHDAVMAEREWRPIGTAPKTGETIIVRLANGEVFSATWHVYGSNPGWHVSSDIGFVNPSHWMPYPATPKAGG